MFTIVLNVVTMMLDPYPPNQYLTEPSKVANEVYNVIFVVEFLVLHAAIGPRAYWSNRVYTFDGTIVLSSVVEKALASGGGLATILRSVRLFRIRMLAGRWQSFRLLLRATVEIVKQMGNFVLLLSLMVFVLALMGQAVFASTFHFDPETGEHVPAGELEARCTSEEGEHYHAHPSAGSGYRYDRCVPRGHFDTSTRAMVTTVQILIGENWNVVMYDGMRAFESVGVGYAGAYFGLGVVVGNSIVLNLFIAS